MRKIVSLIALFLGISVSALAQKTVEYDVFKMNDGRSYIGTVTEETDNYIKLTTPENVERILLRSDIASKDITSVEVESVPEKVKPYVKPAKFSFGIGASMSNVYLGGSYRYHVKPVPGFYVMPGLYLASYQFYTVTMEIPVDFGFRFELDPGFLAVMPYAGPCFSWYVPHWSQIGINGGIAIELLSTGIRIDLGGSSSVLNYQENTPSGLERFSGADFYIGLSYMF